MPTDTNALAAAHLAGDEERWHDLYRRLRPLARAWAYSAGVPTWRGQENDVAEDIIQAALLNVWQYLNLCREKGTPIGSLERLSLVIAKHCFIDMRRRELRFQHFAYETNDSSESLALERLTDLADPAQEAEEKLYEEWLLAASATTIAAFSCKLRAAILADLANNSYFGAEPSVLQQAFLAVGVQLKDFQRAPSPDPAERGRQSALRSLAYKRVSEIYSSERLA
jgi:DNA-directed RNA polymerase specialized sigma24 family protein